MQCTQCGATVVANARFCPACGQPFAGSATRNDIHSATTVVVPRGGGTAVETGRAASDMASLVAGMGRSMVVSQWQRWWWKILIVGVVLYMAVSNVTYSTANVFLLPQLFMIGTFLVPIVYTAYLYEDGTLYDVALSNIALVFFFGGVLGCLAASLLEARLITGVEPGLFGPLTLGDALVVGFSEELAKLIVVVPFLFAARTRYRTVMHGIVLGAAAGMGFAAFESMGYAFLALVATPGGIDQSIQAMHDTIRLRALLAPLGHGTWTAIIAAAMWRERAADRSPFSANVVVAFLLAALLHSAWDYLPPLRLPLLGLPLTLLALGLVGLLILRFFLLVARGDLGTYSNQSLLRELRIYFGGLRDELRQIGRGPRHTRS